MKTKAQKHRRAENRNRKLSNVVRFTPALKATFIKIANVENAVAATSKINKPWPFNPSFLFQRCFDDLDEYLRRLAALRDLPVPAGSWRSRFGEMPAGVALGAQVD